MVMCLTVAVREMAEQAMSLGDVLRLCDGLQCGQRGCDFDMISSDHCVWCERSECKEGRDSERKEDTGSKDGKMISPHARNDKVILMR